MILMWNSTKKSIFLSDGVWQLFDVFEKACHPALWSPGPVSTSRLCSYAGLDITFSGSLAREARISQKILAV